MSRSSSAALLLGIALAVAGCAATPEPEPTPTGFASEEEAFAAAEETYRAYVEATNRAKPDDPASAELIYEWVADDALSASREEFTTAAAEKWTRSGTAVVDQIAPNDASDDLREVTLDVCVDVSDVDVVDENGESLVPADRPDVQSVRVELRASNETRTGLAISRMSPREDGLECDE
ncbi:hypothetical protein [Microbacterium petrolearium]